MHSGREAGEQYMECKSSLAEMDVLMLVVVVLLSSPLNHRRKRHFWRRRSRAVQSLNLSPDMVSEASRTVTMRFELKLGIRVSQSHDVADIIGGPEFAVAVSKRFQRRPGAFGIVC